MNSLIKRWLLVSCCLLGAHLGLGMEIGGNFWNLGWHKPSDCFRDVNSVTNENPWNPQFLEEIRIYRSLRFMDWDNTNNSQRESWKERNAKTAPKQNPVAYEWMIDLCNRNQSDLWICLPHRTVSRETGDQPSDYALRLCILAKTGIDMRETDLTPILGKLSTLTASELIKAGGVKSCEPLEPARKLYVEYSNETWNGMFKQAHYCCNEGEALQLDTNRWSAGFRFHAWAAIRLFRAADLVFGPNSPRVIKVLATQSGNSWITERHVEVIEDPQLNPWQVKANAIAIAPYFGNGVVGDAPDAVAQLRAAIQKSEGHAEKQKRVADRAGLKLIAYEGGQHVIKKAKAINRDPAMYDLYQEYLRAMSKYIEHFCHYAHVGQAGEGGAWGCIEYTGQPIAEAHKYRALKNWKDKQ